MNMKIQKILLVRPPRYLWPFINESDNFLLPLGLPSIAASIRKQLPCIEIKIIDCPPLKIGWNSLESILRQEKPDIVGAGEEALYHHEAVRLFELAKKINPDVITIAGGHFFSWMVEYSLNNYPIDIIVRFEGEETFVHLIQAINSGADLSTVEGVAYRHENAIRRTALRTLIVDLDQLPLPAYDLMPMGKYSPSGYLWPQSATIEHSRGCVDRCSFCSLWTFWGEQIQTDIEHNKLEVNPRYRTKSVERTLEEVDILYNKYKRRYLIWADPTFNVDPKWNDAFCDGLLKRNYKDLYWWAFVRADYTLRDEKLGILEKMVRAGLIHPLVGIERGCSEDLKKIKKSAYTRELVKEVFMLFKRKYPQVFRQGTFVTCLPFDTKESMLNMVNYAIEIDIDYPAFHPVAPVPGTYLYEEAKRNDLIEEKDFKKYDWATPVMRSETGLSQKDFSKLNIELNKRYVLYRPHWLMRGLFSPHKHKRGLYWWFFRNTLKMLWIDLRDTLLGRKKYEGITGFMQLRKPVWYDS
ncbi:MAG: B12-binding domain-containing radical SAM protein [Candidatus Omnitrophica bacterium]|nr:B12-binding domain-containing radical SAM protein [Candidatus Omnitrophota bacterium]